MDEKVLQVVITQVDDKLTKIMTMGLDKNGNGIVLEDHIGFVGDWSFDQKLAGFIAKLQPA